MTTTKETLYYVDGKNIPQRWVDLTVATLVTLWTFIRPSAGWSTSWKVYMVKMGQIGEFPISATDSYWFWKRLSYHESFRFFLTSGASDIRIVAEAWSVDGHRLPKEDILISGSKVMFKKQNLSQNEEDFAELVEASFKRHVEEDEDFADSVEKSVHTEEEQSASSLGALLKENLGTSFGKR
jgi:hypothetical protein